MYLSYINIGQELKHTIPTKNLKQNMKQMYEKTLAQIQLPYSFKSSDVQFTVDKVIVCSDNKGCNYKKDGLEGRTLVDKLVVYRNQEKYQRQNGHKNAKNFVTIYVSGTWNLDGKTGNFNARIFPSMKNMIRYGVSEPLRSSFNPLINSTQNLIDNVMVKATNGFFEKLLNSEKKLKPNVPTVTSIAAQGGSIFDSMNNKNKNRLKHAMANFHEIMELIDTKVDTHMNSYEPRNGKQFKKVSFKPFDSSKYKTLTISNWGYTDIKGARTCKEVQDTFNIFKKAIKDHRIESKIVLDTTTVYKPQPPKGGMKQCPKGNPEASATGRCPDGYIPKPNAKSKKVCCYKKKMTKGEAQRIKTAFDNAKMKIPVEIQKTLEKYIDLKKPATKKKATPKTKELNTKNLKARSNGSFEYRGKKWNCMALKKPELQAIAERMGTGYLLKKTKKVLCEDIHKRLKMGT